MRDRLVEAYDLQERDRGQHVAGTVLARGERGVAGRSADAAVVHPQHGDAPPRQVVGQDEERLVPEDGFVPVLLARSRDEDHDGIRAAPSAVSSAYPPAVRRPHCSESSLRRRRTGTAASAPAGAEAATTRRRARRVAFQREGQLRRALREVSEDGRALIRHRAGERRASWHSGRSRSGSIVRRRRCSRAAVPWRPARGYRSVPDHCCPRQDRSSLTTTWRSPDGALMAPSHRPLACGAGTCAATARGASRSRTRLTNINSTRIRRECSARSQSLPHSRGCYNIWSCHRPPDAQTGHSPAATCWRTTACCRRSDRAAWDRCTSPRTSGWAAGSR